MAETKVRDNDIESSVLSNFLAKDNTTAFTPTEDYNPATKKYVDDNSGGSGGVLSRIILQTFTAQTLTNSVYLNIDWTGLQYKDSDFIHSTSLNPSEITCDFNGGFIVHYDLAVSGVSDLQLESSILINGFVEGGSYRETYVPSGKTGNVVGTFYVAVSQGDIVSTRLKSTGSDSTVDKQNLGLIIERIS